VNDVVDDEYIFFLDHPRSYRWTHSATPVYYVSSQDRSEVSAHRQGDSLSSHQMSEDVRCHASNGTGKHTGTPATTGR